MKIIDDLKKRKVLAAAAPLPGEKRLLLNKILSKYSCLPIKQKLLLFETTFWMLSIAIMLKTIKMTNTDRLLSLLVKSHPNKNSQEDEDTELRSLLGSIHLATSVIRRPKCLLSALLAKILLGRRGYTVKTKIGITRKSGGEVEAHAWVERNGEVILGGRNSPTSYIAVESSAKLFDKLFQV